MFIVNNKDIFLTLFLFFFIVNFKKVIIGWVASIG